MREPEAPSTRDRLLLALRLLAAVGLLIAGYLVYLAVTGQTAPGCGEGLGGCNRVLGSRWSTVLGLPVSVFAVGAYAVILAASIHAGPGRPQRHRDGAWRIIGLVSVAAGVSALWFIYLQLFELSGVCVYCMVAHACSLVLACIALIRARGLLPKLGVVPVVGLIAVQLLMPPPLPTVQQTPGPFGELDPAAAPTLGDSDAPFAIALLFDYNCAPCRDAHRAVAEAVERYDGRLVAVMLPTALDPDCNPGARSVGAHSETSCELARLALAVWLAEPAWFAAFDAWLVAHLNDNTGTPPTRALAEARAYAEQKLGRDQLETLLADPRIDEMLAVHGRAYASATYLGRRGVPRLIINGHPLPGLSNPDHLDQLLRQVHPGLANGPAGEK